MTRRKVRHAAGNLGLILICVVVIVLPVASAAFSLWSWISCTTDGGFFVANPFPSCLRADR